MNKILIIGGMGYIGSLIASFLKTYNFTINTIDELNDEGDYNNLTTDYLKNYNVIILCAGHSSITSCQKNPFNSLKNNVYNFIELCKKISVKFIYMSSSSIYGDCGDLKIEESTDFKFIPKSEYDLQKWLCDEYIQKTDLEYYGLRLGTVCGWYTNLRTDTMINSMVYNGIRLNKIKINNPEIWRPILYTEDLLFAVLHIIRYGNFEKRGIYNLASFNMQVKDIGMQVSEILNIPLEIDYNPTKLSYSFSISSCKFMKTFNFKFIGNIKNIVQDLSNNPIKIPKMFLKNECRVCFSKDLKLILDLGEQPLANSYHTLEEKLDTFPLKLNLCLKCTHTQLSHVVNPSILFENYQYVSGTSNTYKEYIDKLCDRITTKYPNKKRVLDIACNDGTLLDIFKKKGWETVGVDPAKNLYKISSQNHKIFNGFFDENFSKNIQKEQEPFDVIISQNVFAHVDDVHGFLKGCKNLLKSNGKLYIQTSQCDMYNRGEFDTIYHEHLSFFNVKSMNFLLKTENMYIENLTRENIHGNSYLFEIGTTSDFKDDEPEYSLDFFKEYKNKIYDLKKNLTNVIETYRQDKYKIIGYGAAAKGNTVLNFLGVNFDYILDDCQTKWGLYTPGMNILIQPPDVLKNETSRILIVLLAWNFSEEIINKLKKYNIPMTILQYFPETKITQIC